MKRLFILIFALTTLLPSMGFSAMLSSNANEIMTHSIDRTMIMASIPKSKNIHCTSMSSHETCNDGAMTDSLCKVKCATSCTSVPTQLSTLSFVFPFSLHTATENIIFAPFASRSIPPELRPPLV